MEHTLKKIELNTDVLIIGGGTAGCYAALTLSEESNLKVIIAEKANIKRSGCLAAGVNAINAYITKGHVPQDYVDYATKDAAGIVRQDLLLSAAENFNEVTAKMEQLGLVILKDENGDYIARGNRNIKINGENFKPILAGAVENKKNIQVINHLNITDLLTGNGRVYGAAGFSIENKSAYTIKAKAVLIATGGAAGLYRPNNPGFSRHKMWYPPFNTGAGYAMGLKAGAEMTSFEMRFIALRCKDTIAPTGTIAQGVGAKQINAKGEIYEQKYGLTTSERVYGTVMEKQLGNGPCYLRTKGISEEQNEELLKAYLNMAPSQTLKWIESGKKPGEQDVEIEGTEPYIVGGHTASGFWVDTNRQTTIKGLYAAGDVAGGCPQKYVTGALAEAKIAATDIVKKLNEYNDFTEPLTEKENAIIGEYEGYLRGNACAIGYESSFKETADISANEGNLKETADIPANEGNRKENIGFYSIEELEEAMQKVMDEYAGGISTNYQYNETQLRLAAEKIDQISQLSDQLTASSMHELLFIYELKERLLVCKAVIAHLAGRKETRWHAFNENLDYPERNESYEKYLNSKLEEGEIVTFFRNLVKENAYEHTN